RSTRYESSRDLVKYGLIKSNTSFESFIADKNPAIDSTPFISVIMPAYNAGRHIAEAIQSVINQSDQNWELIVVDDCSSDDTALIVQKFSDPRIRLIRQLQRNGPSDARWVGTLAAAHAFVYYFDADDLLCPQALEVLGKALASDPQAVLAYAGYVRINAQSRRIGARRFLSLPSRPSGDVLPAFLKGNYLANGAAVIRRQIVLDTQCWNKSLSYAEDWVAWVILATQGQFHYISQFTALEYRELPTGISQTMGTVFENFVPALNAVYNDPRIASRFSGDFLKKCRLDREAHFWGYMATINVRKKAWRASFQCIRNAVRCAPRHAIVYSLRYLLAVSDAFL
ncbi:MAG: glycosyltransferase family A protein, partial [Alphaproteobacteria bacterium]